MSLPAEPPLDGADGLSLADVQACIWYVWQLTLQDMAAYPTPAALMPVKIKRSYPPPPWGVGCSPTGAPEVFLKDIQNTLDEHTGYRTDLGVDALIAAYDGDRSWGDFADEVYAASCEAGAIS